MGAVETVVDAITDNKIYYNCPKCGREVWAHGSYVGNIVLEKLPLKKLGSINKASEIGVSLNTFLENYYDNSGTIVTINGQKFSNVIPKSLLSKARGYKSVNTNWGYGNNAINICLKMHGYSKQLSASEYEYNELPRCGWSYENFYNKNI
ncbi:hypothetical protein RFI_01517 [Reticulomyxa filosa]|uniref:Uncharacterized protein n=1 Tax=Reticulomyxa filosa TaxID=46433 RepID=X6PAI4_RETFI|nr:hypothetical protein RFI_01517 [Reticulomyxa filosa]|eukprot:ETO35545.1 hypothetical protein RFI_01517 [Reticulomyxa filosa]